jgi:hypothetical protein
MIRVKMENKRASNTRHTRRIMVHGVGEEFDDEVCPQIDGHFFQSLSMHLMKCKTAKTKACIDKIAMYIYEQTRRKLSLEITQEKPTTHRK